jgi:tetratricopeptide (TPR) repeat protein
VKPAIMLMITNRGFCGPFRLLCPLLFLPVPVLAYKPQCPSQPPATKEAQQRSLSTAEWRRKDALLTEATFGGVSPKEEVRLLREALEIDPNDAVVCDALAQALNQVKRHDEALALNERALELAGRTKPLQAYRPGFQMNRAETFAYLGRPSEARVAFQKAIEESPALACAFRRLHGILKAQGLLNSRAQRTGICRQLADIVFWRERYPATDVVSFAKKRESLAVGMTFEEVAQISGYPNFSYEDPRSGFVVWRYVPHKVKLSVSSAFVSATSDTPPWPQYGLDFSNGRLLHIREISKGEL